MNLGSFIDALVKKFPQLGKDPEVDDISDFVAPLSDDGRARLWEEFRNTYTLVSRPNRAVFVATAGKMGISVVRKEQDHEMVCYVCGARFNLTQTTCPKCGNHDKTWRAIIRAGGYRSGKLKGEIEDERAHALSRK